MLFLGTTLLGAWNPRVKGQMKRVCRMYSSFTDDAGTAASSGCSFRQHIPQPTSRCVVCCRRKSFQ